jgi:hypothetical protein
MEGVERRKIMSLPGLEIRLLDLSPSGSRYIDWQKCRVTREMFSQLSVRRVTSEKEIDLASTNPFYTDVGGHTLEERKKKRQLFVRRNAFVMCDALNGEGGHSAIADRQLSRTIWWYFEQAGCCRSTLSHAQYILLEWHTAQHVSGFQCACET